jgi:hypothetical protein
VKTTLKKGLKVFEIVKKERHKIIKYRFTLFHSIKIFFNLIKKNLNVFEKMTYYQYGIKIEIKI